MIQFYQMKVKKENDNILKNNLHSEIIFINKIIKLFVIV